MSDINELKFDKKNFNKHTEYGMSLLEKSLRNYGAGRSILVDKDNNIIAGNGIVESAINAGITKTRVIETTGDELVVVKRKDVELDSDFGREMAFADNATALADIAWDEDLLTDNFDNDYLKTWGVELKWENDLDDVVDKASIGTVADYDEDTEYDLGNLYRQRINPHIQGQLEVAIKEGKIRKEIADVLETRAKQCSIFNFDELTKFYRSGDATEEEKELLKRLYLVFITPKEAIESGMLEIEKTTGEIYDQTLMEKDNAEAD